MISQSRIKLIQSLDMKKNRQKTGFFVVDGDKMVLDLTRSPIEVVEIYAYPSWFEENINSLDQLKPDQLIEVSEKELKKISSFKTPHHVLALARIPDYGPLPEIRSDKLILGLDSIQDPGNFGTIIRSAAWFGVQTLICSKSNANAFNPKVIQASMGALFWQKIYYVDLLETLALSRKNYISVYGTFPEGTSIYEADLKQKGIILMGNESKGISKELFPYINHRLSIPRGKGSLPIDSLNVSIATSIICSEFKRRE